MRESTPSTTAPTGSEVLVPGVAGPFNPPSGPPPPWASDEWPSHFEITLRLDPPCVSNGTWRSNSEAHAKLGVRISGFGHVLAGKVWLDFPPGVLDPKNPGTQYRTIAIKAGDASGKAQLALGKFDEAPLMPYGFVASPIDPFLAFPTPTSGLVHQVPPKTGEMVFERGYPLQIEFNISEAAPEGDHEISAVLTYLTTGGWKGAKATARIHVNTWTEKWGRAIAIIGTISAVLAVAGAFAVLG